MKDRVEHRAAFLDTSGDEELSYVFPCKLNLRANVDAEDGPCLNLHWTVNPNGHIGYRHLDCCKCLIEPSGHACMTLFARQP